MLGAQRGSSPPADRIITLKNLIDMKRFIQYYDENGREMIGSGGVWIFDQRWSNDTIMIKVIEQAKKQTEAYRQCPEKFAPQLAASADIRKECFTGFTCIRHFQLEYNEVCTAGDYMLLSRLKDDCEYYLGFGNRDAKHALWARDEQKHIDKMRELYDKVNPKPEWLTIEQINEYAKNMEVN